MKVWTTCLCMLICATTIGAGEGRRQDPPGGRGGPKGTFFTKVPDYPGNVIIGRPTDTSVTLSILLKDTANVVVSFGEAGRNLDRKSGTVALRSGEPGEVLLDGLKPDSNYEYRILDAVTGKPIIPEKTNGTFHTCRMQGSAFTFTVTADSHLDENCQPDLYTAVLKDTLTDKPDFHIDLGDTFMTGKHGSRDSAALQYLAQRYYFGLIGHSAPIYLVPGNHDGEETFRPDFTGPDGLAAWSCVQRKRFFPNPEPGTFYSGNTEKQPGVGLLEDYYSWMWGDALFVVLDPYWTSKGTRGGKDQWGMTLGKLQYDWLARTLRSSKAKYKFIFVHQLVGGFDKNGRGGIEAAPFFEWGGHEKDGADTFAAKRPGWEKPIHSLLVENRVTMVFHGHDHFFARQELDGIVYQLVPQPAQRNQDSTHALEYGYQAGDFLPNSGYLRVQVGGKGVTVDYMRAPERQDMRQQGIVNRRPACSYTCGTAPK